MSVIISQENLIYNFSLLPRPVTAVVLISTFKLDLSKSIHSIDGILQYMVIQGLLECTFHEHDKLHLTQAFSLSRFGRGLLPTTKDKWTKADTKRLRVVEKRESLFFETRCDVFQLLQSNPRQWLLQEIVKHVNVSKTLIHSVLFDLLLHDCVVCCSRRLLWSFNEKVKIK